MYYSKTELRLLSELGKGNEKVADIAKALGLSVSQTYRVARTLAEKGILQLNEGVLIPQRKTHVHLLLKNLSKAPSLSQPLSGVGMNIFTAMLEPKTVAELEQETHLHKTYIFKKIKEGRRISLLQRDDKRYKFNDILWPDLRDGLAELYQYERTVDERVPVDAIIYYKNKDEIVFSSPKELDAVKTAFSAYVDYGIKLLLLKYYYYLPKKSLTLEEVFQHSLYVAQKENDIQSKIFVALFYAKYKKQLVKIRFPILDNLDRVFAGEQISGYPSLAEIKDRLDVYRIEVPHDK